MIDTKAGLLTARFVEGDLIIVEKYYPRMPNKKLQLTIAKAARLAAPSRAPFAIAAELWR